MLKTYPWTQTEIGQGFFVPALNLKAVREQGLLAAVKQQVTDGRAVFCIKDGRLGVWFCRGRVSSKLQAESSLV